MKKIYLMMSLSLLCSLNSMGQRTNLTYPIELSFFNNGNFMPGAGVLGVWSPKIHPGFSLGTRFYYREAQKSALFQTAKLGYFFHRHAQQGVQLYTELGYRHKLYQSLYVEPKLGLGYLISIPDMQVFNFKDGAYDSKSIKARSQLMGGIDATLGYSLAEQTKLPLDVFLGYQFWVQSPFVKGYVPVLPNNSVHVGVIYYLSKTSKNDQ